VPVVVAVVGCGFDTLLLETLLGVLLFLTTPSSFSSSWLDNEMEEDVASHEEEVKKDVLLAVVGVSVSSYSPQLHSPSSSSYVSVVVLVIVLDELFNILLPALLLAIVVLCCRSGAALVLLLLPMN